VVGLPETISEKASRRSKELVLSLQLHDGLKVGGGRSENQACGEL
jgi:hypothetical protein